MSAFHRWILPNGLTCLYKQSERIPLAAASLLIRAGSAYETPAEAGLASLTADLMLQGTRRRPSRRIADEIESVGASLGSNGSEDYTEVSFSSPQASLPRIVDVVIDILTDASFPADEITKERADVLASFDSRRDSLFTVAYDALSTAMFGPDHPYGRLVDGRKETVRGFSRKDFERWYRRHIRPEEAVLSMVGSLPAREAERHMQRSFNRWSGLENGSSSPQLLDQPPTLDQSIRLKARFEQAYLMTAVRAPAVLHPDYAVLKVVNTILGGGMSSRLFLKLREELGLAYEVSSFFPTRLYASQWVIYMGMPPEKLRVAKQELNRILDRLQDKGPTVAEVRQAVAMIHGAYLMEYQARRKQAWYGAWWGFLGKDPEHDRAFLKAVSRVSPRQARDLARQLLSQPRVTVEVSP